MGDDKCWINHISLSYSLWLTPDSQSYKVRFAKSFGCLNPFRFKEKPCPSAARMLLLASASLPEPAVPLRICLHRTLVIRKKQTIAIWDEEPLFFFPFRQRVSFDCSAIKSVSVGVLSRRARSTELCQEVGSSQSSGLGTTLKEMSQLNGKRFVLLVFALHMLNLWGKGHYTLLLPLRACETAQSTRNTSGTRKGTTQHFLMFPMSLPTKDGAAWLCLDLPVSHASARPVWAFMFIPVLYPSWHKGKLTMLSTFSSSTNVEIKEEYSLQTSHALGQFLLPICVASCQSTL